MELDLKLNLFHSTAEIRKKTGKKYLRPIHFTIIFHNLRNFRLPVAWTSALGAYEVKKAALSVFFMEIVKAFFKEARLQSGNLDLAGVTTIVLLLCTEEE